VTYAVALHELGHILGPHQTKERLWKEIGAWIWAKQRAKEWPPAAQRKLEDCLQSYIDWAWSKQNRGRKVYFPEPDDEFWELLLALKTQ
jgi:hypothetical protein